MQGIGSVFFAALVAMATAGPAARSAAHGEQLTSFSAIFFFFFLLLHSSGAWLRENDAGGPTPALVSAATARKPFSSMPPNRVQDSIALLHWETKITISFRIVWNRYSVLACYENPDRLIIDLMSFTLNDKNFWMAIVSYDKL